MTNYAQFANMTDDALIAEWQSVQSEVKRLRELETRLRNEVVARRFAETDGKKGTFTEELGNGWKLKCVRKQTISLDNKKVELMLETLSNLGSDGKFIADRLVSFKPVLSVREYEALDEASRAIVNEAIVIKDALPTVTLVEPKA